MSVDSLSEVEDYDNYYDDEYNNQEYQQEFNTETHPSVYMTPGTVKAVKPGATRRAESHLDSKRGNFAGLSNQVSCFLLFLLQLLLRSPTCHI
jgi:hypothetical protein